ncbi:hypothetical protein [Spiroplasma ixodetis]|uniref:hypothetical protein n=1 Tax=Spiroplasma ixodetis TaxID=2141 RepID=UPI002574B75A|nr:hypothetical protein [Spiroplasma ixodetis]
MNVEGEQVKVWKLCFGNTFYKHICTKHYIEEGLLLLNIKEILKEKLGGENNAVIK